MDYYACDEHVELAMDHIIDESEVAPEMEKIENETSKCSFCEEKAVYKICG